MCNRFLKLIPSEETRFLAKEHPNAFILLFFIADRARRENGHPDGLTIGQCHVGDWENMGLTRQEYRTALNTLVIRNIIKKVETCRTRQKSTTGATTLGTLVTLCSASIYDINSNGDNHRFNHRPTTDQPPTNHEQEGIRKKKKEKEEKPQTPFSSSPPVPSKLKFREFVELTQEQHDTLMAKHGQETLDLMLDKLDSYKGSSGTKYNSDFHTMKEGGWVIKQVRKDMNAQKQSDEKPFKHNPGAQSNGVSQGSPAKFQAARVLRGTNEGSVASGGSHE